MRTHQLVLGWIEEQLRAGSLAIGQRLPGERALAEQFGLSRTSVREAIRVLEALGVARSGVGSGPESGTTIVADPSTALGSALRLHVASSHLPVADMVQTRIMIESWACLHAAPDSPALPEAAELLTAMERLGPEEIEQFLLLDVRFHFALTEAAGNAVVSAIMLSLREGIKGYISAATDGQEECPAVAARLHTEHRGILAAIQSGRSREASDLVAEHIEGFYQDLRTGRLTGPTN